MVAYFLLRRLSGMYPCLRNHTARPIAIACCLLAQCMCKELTVKEFFDQFERLSATYTRLSLGQASELARTVLHLCRWSIADITVALYSPAGPEAPLTCTAFEWCVERLFNLVNVQARFEQGPAAEVVDTPQLVPLLLSSPSQYGLYLLVG